MNQLSVIPPASLPALFESEIDSARSFAEQEKAASTRKGYASDWRIFTAWAHGRGVCALPALPAHVAAFLASQATAGVKVSTLGCRVSSIRYAHLLAGHEPPTSSETVKVVMRGIRRTVGVRPDQKAPATASVLTEMLRHCPDTLTGLRDRALLLIGFAAALRRSELVALRVEDVHPVEDGARITIRRSKTDQEARGVRIAIPRGLRLRPVAALTEWLDAAGITEGPLFRPVAKGARVQSAALTDRSVATIIKRYALAAGFDPAIYSGHSLRAGFITSAAENGASVHKMQAVSRHKTVNVLFDYVRAADDFADHAGRKFL